MTTYYVDGAVGNDTNAGTSEGSGNAWATIQKAADTVAAGDVVYVKASANYNELVDTSASGLGTRASPIWFIGYTSTPGDDGHATIDAQSTRNHCIDYSTLSNSVYHRWHNFILTGCVSRAVDGANADFIIFQNCKLHNNASLAFNLDNYIAINHCEVYDNSNAAAYLGYGAMLSYSRFWSNAYGLYFITCSFEYLIHCVFSNATATGQNFFVDGGPGASAAAVGNIFDYTDAGTVGLQEALDGSDGYVFLGNNVVKGDSDSSLCNFVSATDSFLTATNFREGGSDTLMYQNATTPSFFAAWDVNGTANFADPDNQDMRPTDTSDHLDVGAEPGCYS